MRFTKRKIFLLLNGIIAAALSLYFSFWILSPKAVGEIQHPLSNSTTMIVKYTVGKKLYTTTLLRSGIPYLETKVVLHYNKWNPSDSRINSFLGFVAEPLGWWLVFLFASTVLLLTNNSVFSKGTIFIFQKSRPYLVIEEFYPVKFWWQQKPKSTETNTAKKNKDRLLE